MRQFEIGQGHTVLVDDDDYKKIIVYNWYPQRTDTKIYARTSINGECVLMHRLITEAPEGMDVDHENNNGLDNQRTNLRICSRSQNLANRGKQKNNTSGYKGVSWNKKVKKWQAKVTKNRQQFHLGYFDSAIEASGVYNKNAKLLYREFAYKSESECLLMTRS